MMCLLLFEVKMDLGLVRLIKNLNCMLNIFDIFFINLSKIKILSFYLPKSLHKH